MTELRVVLCEGYDDRAFWKGWLQHLGCKEKESLKTEYRGQGQYAYVSGSDDVHVVVKPYQGLNKLGTQLGTTLRRQKPSRIIINRDADTEDASDSVDRSLDSLAESQGLQKHDSRTWSLDGGLRG